MVRLLMVMVLIARVALGSDRPPRVPDQTRPLEDIRRFVGTVPVADGFDLYWLRTNELVPPITNRLYRTSFGHDGRRLAAAVIHEAPTLEFFPPRLATTADGMLVFWREYRSQPAVVRVSRLEGDRLVDSGTRLSGLWDSSSIQVDCGASDCLALWNDGARTRGAYFAEDGSMLGEAFDLPPGAVLSHAEAGQRSLVSADGALLLREYLPGEYFVTLIDRQGNVVFDARLPVPQSARGVTLASDGVRYVAFWDQHRGTTTSEGPRDLWAVEIDRSGRVHDMRQVAASPDNARSWLYGFNAIWTGHEFLLAGTRWTDGVPDLIVLRLDSALQRIGEPLVMARRMASHAPFLERVGDNVVIGWRSPMLQIALYSNGKLSPAVQVHPDPRRRAVSR